MYDDGKGLGGFITVFRSWVLSIVGLVLGTILLPINLVLGLVNDDTPIFF